MKTQNLVLATALSNYAFACKMEHDRITKPAVARAERACIRASESLAILNRNRTEGTYAVWQDTSKRAKDAVQRVKPIDFDEYIKLKKRYATILG